MASLLKVGIEVSQATVAKYMGRRIGNPSPTWRTFLRNRRSGIVAIDMLVVPSATFRILFVMLILAHDRKKIVRFDVAQHPTAGGSRDSNLHRWTLPAVFVADGRVYHPVYHPGPKRTFQTVGLAVGDEKRADGYGGRGSPVPELLDYGLGGQESRRWNADILSMPRTLWW